MTLLKKNTARPSKNMKGFTLIELMFVMATMSVLAAIAFANFNQMKQKTYDKTALTDARNLVDSLIDVTLGEDSVIFNKIGTGGAVGIIDTALNPREPVYILSPGVVATIIGSTNAGGGSDTVVLATIHHPKGTPGIDYSCQIDERTGLVSLP